ncbi:MAG: polysaccharide export protein [Armatimonadetes bacterium]|nr:polysaccharide export protein [Armatimonadota bacterium]
MRPNRLLAILVLMLGLIANAMAQSTSTETYRLQPEDIIVIQIYRIPEVDAVLPVGPDGNISAPFVGMVKAAGKTTKELEHDLSVLYVERLRLKDPIVSVTIRNYREIKASVNGFVGRPGVYTMRPGDRILDLLSVGGGTSTDGRADLRRAFLIRKGSQERIPIDLRSMLSDNDSSQNFEVQDGDVLWVPDMEENQVTIAGRVQRPGPVTFREKMRLSQVINQAGEINRRSKLSKIQVFRRLPGRESTFLAIEADLVAFNTGKDPNQDITLQPGDFIYVPDSGNIDYDIVNSVASMFFIFDRFGFSPFRTRG